jgi:predicted protein tyrosine phosphatase
LKTVYNVPRIAARDFGNDDPRLPENLVWISIAEPGDQRSIVSNKYLDRCANLKLAFWDIREPMEFKGETLQPPSERDARKIVKFLLQHSEKSVYVNCAAGVSRSGAVAQFCADFLGHKWLDHCKDCAIPNSRLYTLLVEAFQKEMEKKYN